MKQTLADIAIILGQSPELSLVVKMTIAAALGLAVVRYARAARASVRHLVLTSTFGALFALPVAMLIVPANAIELPWATRLANDTSSPTTAVANGVTGSASVVDANAGKAANDGGSAAAGQPAQAINGEKAGIGAWLPALGRTVGLLSNGDAGSVYAPGANGSRPASMPWLAMIRVVWLAGAAFLLAMFALALFRLRAIRRTGLPWLERRDDVARVAAEAGVRQSVTVMLHERVAAPLTCGWRHPVIVFPADAREWSDGDVRRVLLHELEHVRRGDWMVQLAARTICAVYWFHPLVWTAWRQLCLEAERACDDAVVRSEAGTDYAEQLVLLARRMSDAPAQPMVAMASRSDLSARVTALLDHRQQRGRAGAMTFVTAIGAASIIVLTIGPLRAVAAVGDQAGSAITTDGRGSGSGSGAGAGKGDGQGSGSDAASGANTVTAAAPGSVTSRVAGGVADGVPGGVPGGVVGGTPGGVSGGTPGGVPGGVVGGRPGGVVGGVPGGVSGSDAQQVVDGKRRSSLVEHALGEAFIEAAAKGNVRALQEVLEAGVDVNTKVSGDGSALIAASRRGQIPAIRYLLERGADVNMGVDGDGNPLIMAAAYGQVAAVTLLLERGADIEAVVDGDENALIQAAGRGHLEVVKLLVARGANVNASVRVDTTSDGQPKTEVRTPLNMARRGGHTAVVEFLQSAGAAQ